MRTMLALALVAVALSLVTAAATWSTRRDLREVREQHARLEQTLWALEARAGAVGAATAPVAAPPPAAEAARTEALAAEATPEPAPFDATSARGRQAVIARFDGLEGPSRTRAVGDLALFARMGDPDARESLFGALADVDADVRMEAIEAVAGLGDREAIDRLSQLVADTDIDIRLELAEELGASNNPAAGPVLQDMLDDDSPLVVVEALKALADLGYEPARRDFQRYADSPEIEITGAAGEGLASIGDRRGAEEAIDRLAASARHDDPRVRQRALNEIARIGGESAVRHLAEALDDPDPGVRSKAEWHLEHLGQ